jgi:ribonuclease III
MSEDRAGEPGSRRAGGKDGAGERESARAGEKARTKEKNREKVPEAALPGSDSRSTRIRSEGHSEVVSHPKPRLDALQSNMGHFFRDTSLLRQALTHPSAALEEGQSRLSSYERLEFLGDAVLHLELASLIFDLFPKADEGVLSRLRAYWASEAVQAEAARVMGLDGCLRLGAGETRDGGAHKERILASALEACVGALHLDGGQKACTKLVKALWKDAIRHRALDVLAEDAKTALQEVRQARGLPLPEYRTKPSGEGFASSVLLDGEEAGRGEGPTRKAAEQASARAALARLSPAAARERA